MVVVGWGWQSCFDFLCSRLCYPPPFISLMGRPSEIGVLKAPQLLSTKELPLCSATVTTPPPTLKSTLDLLFQP